MVIPLGGKEVQQLSLVEKNRQRRGRDPRGAAGALHPARDIGLNQPAGNQRGDSARNSQAPGGKAVLLAERFKQPVVTRLRTVGRSFAGGPRLVLAGRVT